MDYKEIINSIKPYDYSKYKDVTSYEKLMVTAAYYLVKQNVPLTFNYICIASFKMFPDMFCCDNEFKEFPSVDRLNRTMMHLKYVKTNLPYLVGTQEAGYTLTNYGRATATEIEAIINNSKIDKSVKAPLVDRHKKGVLQDYTKFSKSDLFAKYKSDKTIDINCLWKFFNVIPYTQTKRIKKELDEIKKYALSIDDKQCVECIKTIVGRI